MRSFDQDTLPAPIVAVLQLFDGPLATVAFPDVDRAQLTALATEAAAAQTELAAARARLAEAQAAIIAAEASALASRSALSTRAQRALSYARVYAEGDAELTQALASVDLGLKRAPQRELHGLVIEQGATPRKRGRSRNSRSLEATPTRNAEPAPLLSDA